jgi:hypothetical protein
MTYRMTYRMTYHMTSSVIHHSLVLLLLVLRSFRKYSSHSSQNFPRNDQNFCPPTSLMDTSVEYLLHLWFHLHSRDRRSVYRYGLLDSVILYAHIGTGSAGGLTFGESARSLAQPAWRGGVLGCGFPNINDLEVNY